MAGKIVVCFFGGTVKKNTRTALPGNFKVPPPPPWDVSERAAWAIYPARAWAKDPGDFNKSSLQGGPRKKPVINWGENNPFQVW